MNVLFICTGNRFRSPLAMVMAQKLRPDWNFDSAGVGKGPYNKTPSRKMRQLGELYGVSLADYFSKPISLELCRWSNVIIGMQPSHLKYVSEKFSVSRRSLRLLNTHGKIEDFAFLSRIDLMFEVSKMIHCVRQLVEENYEL